MLNQLSDYVRKQKLFQSEERILLAVSGGIDSVVMLHLFDQTAFSFAVAHCNFHLRGTASDGDETFVRELCEQFDIPFFTKSFDTESYAKEHGISIQMAARDLRREWFEEVLDKEKYSKIATAHHLNDSLETTIFNLAKGTGIAGLQGILPQKGKYIRPLLFATREMIEIYANKHELEWREDQSNSSIKYSRNLIRHKVIPELKKINPNLEGTFSQTMEKLEGATTIFKTFIGKHKSGLLLEKDGIFGIDKSQIERLDNASLMLFEMLEEYGFNYTQVKDVLQALDSQSGKVFYSSSHQLTMDREKLYLQRKKELADALWEVTKETRSLQVDDQSFVFKTVEMTHHSIDTDPSVASLDIDKLDFPLAIRYWQYGDVFFPLGMKHKKKVSDFMIDEKIPVNLKKQTLILLSGDKLVWVVGHRIDDRFKITNHTRKVFRVSIDAQ